MVIYYHIPLSLQFNVVFCWLPRINIRFHIKAKINKIPLSSIQFHELFLFKWIIQLILWNPRRSPSHLIQFCGFPFPMSRNQHIYFMSEIQSFDLIEFCIDTNQIIKMSSFKTQNSLQSSLKTQGSQLSTKTQYRYGTPINPTICIDNLHNLWNKYRIINLTDNESDSVLGLDHIQLNCHNLIKFSSSILLESERKLGGDLVFSNSSYEYL